MALSPLQCPKCLRLLEVIPNWEDCSNCETPLEIAVFPALFKERTPGQVGDALLLEGESSCFYHSTRKAVLPCEGCGRFLCALCDCELSGRHFCPVCLESGKSKGKITNLERQRVLYDTIALILAIAPVASILFWFLSIFTAPAALFLSIRYWNAPRSLVHRTKVRYVIAMVLATLQIAGWGVLIYVLFGRAVNA
jgi:hypothetical protein